MTRQRIRRNLSVRRFQSEASPGRSANTTWVAATESNNFAHVGKIDYLTLSGWSFDDIETDPTAAQGGHHESAAFIRRISLVVAPAAERYRLVQVEVGPTLACGAIVAIV
jgi:hypothetical protein